MNFLQKSRLVLCAWIATAAMMYGAPTTPPATPPQIQPSHAGID